METERMTTSEMMAFRYLDMQQRAIVAQEMETERAKRQAEHERGLLLRSIEERLGLPPDAIGDSHYADSDNGVVARLAP